MQKLLEVINISSFKTTKITNPYNETDEVLELNINDGAVYRLNNVIKVSGTYTFSIWYKTNKNTTITLRILGNESQISSTTSWQKFVKTVTINSVTEQNNDIDIEVTSGAIGYFYEAFLSEGVSDTSWSPAPEDIDENVESVRSEFKQTAEEINTSVKNIKGDVSNLNIQIGKIEQSVKDNKGNISSLTTTVDGIKGTVEKQGESISNINQKADKISQDVTSVRNDLSSKITQTAEQINQKVDDVKSELSSDITQTAGQISQEVTNVRNDLTSKITQTEKKISQEIKDVNDNLSSRIDQTAGSITSTVKSEIDKIAIGGRNIAVGTSVSKENSRSCDYHVSSVVFETGDYTVSFYAKASKHETASVYLNDDSGANRIGIIFSSEINLTEEYQKFTFTKKNNKEYSGDVNGIVIRIYGKTETDNTISVKELKLEIGNKATDWSPAPEDVEEDIDNAQSAADDAKDKADSTEERVTASESKIEQLSDSISTMVTDKNGNSLMTQTGDGWTFNMGTIEDTLDDAKQTLKDLEGDMGVVDSTLSQLESLTNDLGKKTAYINMTTDDSGAPCLELGKSDSAFKVRISNTSVDFIEGSVRIAYISNRALYIERAIIKNEFQIGDNGGFIFRKRSSGNMCVRWVGGVD